MTARLYLPALLAVLLAGAGSAQKYRDDPFEDLLSAQETTEMEWLAAHRELTAKLPSMNSCRAEFRDSITAVQQKMLAAFRARRQYLSAWSELVKRKMTSSTEVLKSVPAQLAKLHKDLQRVTELKQDAQRRRADLLAGGHAEDSPEAAAAIDLAASVEKEAALIREEIALLEKDRNDVASLAARDKAMGESIQKRISLSVGEQGAWDNLYSSRLQRGRISCREGFK